MIRELQENTDKQRNSIRKITRSKRRISTRRKHRKEELDYQTSHQLCLIAKSQL